MISLALIVLFPRLRSKFLIRLGIYCGVILSIQYLIAVILTSFFISIVVAIIAAPLLAFSVWVAGLVIKRHRRFTILHLMIFTAIVAVSLTLILALMEEPAALLFGPFIFLFVAGPTLNCATYCRLGYAVFNDSQKQNWTSMKRTTVSGIVAWLAAYLAAWKISIDLTLDEYSRLPLANPNCFVASAAANGHPAMVGSREMATLQGIVLINLQMQRLKFFEFALQAAVPSIHVKMRVVYNWLGPRLAHVFQRSRLAADLAYLLLKPVEWLSAAVCSIARIDDQKIREIYVGKNNVGKNSTT
jgi:hypothetical protein